MIDHISVGVADLDRSRKFYEAVFAPLGLSALFVRPATVGFGKSYPEFWINLRAGMAPVPPQSGTHICLRARSASQIDAFHAAALVAGGRSDGAPARARNITKAITQHSSPIRTATASRW
jgi:catechol 2,3-dioxygenase-like lactoylglutathione lyase family enzyme